MTMTVVITGTHVFKGRFWIATQLFKLGARILGVGNIEVTGPK